MRTTTNNAAAVDDREIKHYCQALGPGPSRKVCGGRGGCEQPSRIDLPGRWAAAEAGPSRAKAYVLFLRPKAQGRSANPSTRPDHGLTLDCVAGAQGLTRVSHIRSHFGHPG
jgi:hypothetical protein|uniref:Uncharacterized protein n=1 Tax=Sipha flava TaxID=143950 RepID=A0A2S2RAF1_9HEMI